MATLKDIATETGLSVMTVSKILNGRNQEKWASTKKRGDMVRAVAKRLGYKPNSAARSIRGQSFKQIGVVILNTGAFKLHYMPVYEFISGLNDYLEEHGYILSVLRLNDFNEQTEQTRFFQEKLFDAFVFIGLHEAGGYYRQIEQLCEHVIWVDSNIYDANNAIRRDEADAGKKAVDMLLQAGIERIIWHELDPGKIHFSGHERHRAITGKCRDRIDLQEIDLRYYRIIHCQTKNELTQLLTPNTGIIVPDSLVAQQILVATTKFDLVPGRDYSLVSCDEISADDYTWPDLSRISHDRFGIGTQAGEMVMALLAGKPVLSRKPTGESQQGATICINNRS